MVDKHIRPDTDSDVESGAASPAKRARVNGGGDGQSDEDANNSPLPRSTPPRDRNAHGGDDDDSDDDAMSDDDDEQRQALDDLLQTQRAGPSVRSPGLKTRSVGLTDSQTHTQRIAEAGVIKQVTLQNFMVRRVPPSPR